jgi:hypothetical protein
MPAAGVGSAMKKPRRKQALPGRSHYQQERRFKPNAQRKSKTACRSPSHAAHAAVSTTNNSTTAAIVPGSVTPANTNSRMTAGHANLSTMIAATVTIMMQDVKPKGGRRRRVELGFDSTTDNRDFDIGAFSFA